MERVNVTFKGMTNTPDDGFNSAGEMALLMNADIKNGEIVPMYGESSIHKGEGKKVLKAVWFKGRVLELYYSSSYGRNVIIDPTDDGGDPLPTNNRAISFENFEVIGNVIVGYGVEAYVKGIYYWVYKDNSYYFLGELPTLKELYISLTEKVSKISSGDALWTGEGRGEGSESLYNMYYQKGTLDKCLSALYQEGCYIDQAQFRLAIKLFDGSYIWASPVYFASFVESERLGISCGYDNFFWKKASSSYENNLVQYYALIAGFKPSFSFPNKYDFTDWADIIDSVCLFSSGSIMMHKAEHVINRNGLDYDTYTPKTSEEVRADMVDGVMFYKVAEYDLEGNLVRKVENTSPSNLAVQDVLVGVENKRLYAKKTYVYNSRLHVSDYEKIFVGLTPAVSCFVNQGSTDESCNIYAKISISTKDGDKSVVAKKTGVTLTSYREFITPLLVVPNENAYELDLYLEYGGGVYHKKFPLKRHKTYNYSYYLYPNYANGSGDEFIPGIPLSEFMSTSYPNLTESDSAYEENVMCVSNIDSPFYFPSAQTYSFDSEIKAMMSNAEAVSTGQFGQYPLFVFTSSGIWAMQADSTGRFAYVSQAIFSRDVCIGGVTPTRYGVAFVTESGVKMISGNQVIDLSQMIDGGSAEMLNDSTTTELLNNVFNIVKGQVYQNQSLPTIEPIKKYIDKTTGLGYFLREDKLVVFRPEKAYSYIYNFETKTWNIFFQSYYFKAEGAGKYGELVLFRTINNDTESVKIWFAGGEEIEPFLAVTRPFTLETFDFKRIRQAALRCTFKGTLNFYLLGSNDGAKFYVITGKEYPANGSTENTDVTRRDLITAMSRSKQYKYFAIAIAGNMEGRISMAELLVEPGFAVNKLR